MERGYKRAKGGCERVENGGKGPGHLTMER